MRKFFFIAVMLLSMSVTAQQRTFTKSVSINYATKQVTFKISWAAGSRGSSGASTYNSKIWVLVDYQEVRNGVPYGSWRRATVDLTRLPANCTADGTNTKGFWYQGQASAAQNANITVTLTNVPAQFKWCASATDCPPQVSKSTAGAVTFKGTPPFNLTYSDGSTATASGKNYTLTKILTAFTDATNCPGSVPPSCSVAGQTPDKCGCCDGLAISNNKCATLASVSCTAATFSLGSTGFANTQTWVIGAQTWSAPVTATYCNKSAYNASTSAPYNADCKKIDYGATHYYFSWCAVAQFANQLCPCPWRVPTRNDFIALDKALGGTGINRDNASNYYKFFAKTGTAGQYWGAENLQCAVDASGNRYCGASGCDAAAWYWTIENYSQEVAYDLGLLYRLSDYYYQVYPDQYQWGKYYGFSVRCVKD